MKFRLAEEKDIDDIIHIENTCFSMPWSRETLLHEINENDLATLIVAEEKGVVIGYMGIWCIMDEGHITNVSVLPEYERRGIGSKLIEETTAIAKAKGVDKMTLEVRESNEKAISLYEKFGFERAGLRKNYYDDNGENALIMWKVNI